MARAASSPRASRSPLSWGANAASACGTRPCVLDGEGSVQPAGGRLLPLFRAKFVSLQHACKQRRTPFRIQHMARNAQGALRLPANQADLHGPDDKRRLVVAGELVDCSGNKRIANAVGEGRGGIAGGDLVWR